MVSAYILVFGLLKAYFNHFMPSCNPLVENNQSKVNCSPHTKHDMNMFYTLNGIFFCDFWSLSDFIAWKRAA